MTLRPLLLAAAVGALASASPAAAQADSVNYFSRTHSAALPTLLQQEDRFFYLSLFEAIEAQNWDRVELMLTQRPDGPLHGAALATYYLDPNSPRIDLSRIEAGRYELNEEAISLVHVVSDCHHLLKLRASSPFARSNALMSRSRAIAAGS